MASRSSSSGEFDFLTEKQIAVLDLLANNRTSKEIAWTLGVSETAINRRIEAVRLRLGGVTRHELARRYREWAAARDQSLPTPAADKSLSNQDFPCVETATRFLQLAGEGDGATDGPKGGETVSASFEDPVAMAIDAPWKEWKEPRIVPRVLDGNNATLARGAAIGLALILILAILVLTITVAKVLAEAVG